MSTTRIQQLEPCPFCNSANGTVQHLLLWYRVICENCRAYGPKSRSYHQALSQWEHQSRELRLEKSIENRQLLEHLSSFGNFPPPRL
ncbi:Lar family restriction alleviation protein [Sansalvadorimonas verongulae]|uniref:Lar family restriction alleviation protein n=1 Tax=Sansalvadorimonas verongulae TaxID=2172824 RepID=UPI0012BB9B65|nr:Lar family restriction alleviation protein [Sansalvadorimonas verongulae]MTI14508.1 hypothetical protein [Sansalvadorimonas verongulae]